MASPAFIPSGSIWRISKPFALPSNEAREALGSVPTIRSRRKRAQAKLSKGADPKHVPLQVAKESKTGSTIRPRTENYFSIPYDELVIRTWQPRDREACIELIGAILAEYGLEWDPTTADKDVVEVEKAYHHGEFWVIEDVQSLQIVGTGAFYEVPQRGIGAIEIRKMYLSPKVRRRGLGSFLLAALEERARQLEYSMAYIETASVLKEACALYKARSYVLSDGLETERCDLVLEKELLSSPPSTASQPVEAVDSTRGWTVSSCSRKQAMDHGILYRAVVVLVESHGRIFVHKRSLQKSTFPGRMSIFVTGCIDWMESPWQAAKREVFEETGLSSLDFSEPFNAFIANGKDGLGQRILFHPFIARGEFEEKDTICNPAEVEFGKFMSRDEIVKGRIGGSLWDEFRSHGF